MQFLKRCQWFRLRIGVLPEAVLHLLSQVRVLMRPRADGGLLLGGCNDGWKVHFNSQTTPLPALMVTAAAPARVRVRPDDKMFHQLPPTTHNPQPTTHYPPTHHYQPTNHKLPTNLSWLTPKLKVSFARFASYYHELSHIS